MKNLLLTLSVLIIGGALEVIPQSEAQIAGPASDASAHETAGWRFEAASIRPAPDPSVALAAMAAGKTPHLGTKIDAGRLDMGSVNLKGLIMTAYSVRFDQVNGPDWLATRRFDILATFPAGATEKEVPEMLRALLEERFKLKVHRENKLDPVYALLVGPKGPKLEPAMPDELFVKGVTDGNQLGRGPGRMGGLTKAGPFGPTFVLVGNGVAHTEFAGISTEQLAQYFGGSLGRPVMDRTGIQGKYHVILDRDLGDVSVGSAAGPAISGDDGNHGPSGIATDPQASVFSAIEKLGLKLESRKDYVEHIVVDHIEKEPSDN